MLRTESYHHYLLTFTGGFYQDEVGGGVIERNGTGCKYCLKGRYVPPSIAPGRKDSDCKVCPTGMDHKKHSIAWQDRGGIQLFSKCCQ